MSKNSKLYLVRMSSGEEATFARKESAIRCGEKSGDPYRVFAPSGVLVYDAMGDDDVDPGMTSPAEEPSQPQEAPRKPKKDAKAKSPKVKSPKAKAKTPAKAKDEPSGATVMYVHYREFGPKHHWIPLRAAAITHVNRLPYDGVLGAKVVPGWMIKIFGTDNEDMKAAAESVGIMWGEALAALADYKADREASSALWEATGRERLLLEWDYLTRFGEEYIIDII